MELIEEWEETSAYTFLSGKKTDDEITELINEYGSDQDLITSMVNEKYPEDKYFVLIDYIEDGNLGYFHIRIWEL